MLETRDLILKKAAFEDWPDIYANLWRHWESARYMLWSVTESEEAARERMRRTLLWQESHDHAYFVYEKHSGKAIGFAGMMEIAPGVWDETGVALGPDYVGRGFGGQILDALVQSAFSLGGREFRASCREQNERSRRLILSRGFRPRSTERLTDERTGEKYTLLHFRLSAPEQDPLRSSRSAAPSEKAGKSDPRPLAGRNAPEDHRNAVLNRAFYEGGAVKTAPLLLGKLLCRKTPEGLSAGMIVEAEAYCGPEDDAAHSFGGRRTARTEAMFGPPGRAYVFRLYGMHSCFNVVTAPEGQPQAVLIRALEPVEGLELMRRRRGREEKELLCSGPGKLCQAMDIGPAQYGLDLCGGELFLAEYRDFAPAEIYVSPRVNVDYAREYRDRPWRFFVKGNPFVSRVPRRFAPLGTLDGQSAAR